MPYLLGELRETAEASPVVKAQTATSSPYRMLLNLNTDPADHSSCALFYNEHEHWLQAAWQGYVDPAEAMRGAQAYLRRAALVPCAYLLNDNTNLRGPWFESLDWLLDVWVPEATHLGLRYVAHIVQADSHHDLFTGRNCSALPFELQIFQEQSDALTWLRWMRDVNLLPLPDKELLSPKGS